MAWQVLIVVAVAALALVELRRLERDPAEVLSATVLRVAVGVIVAVLGGLAVNGSVAAAAVVLAVAALLLAPAVSRLLTGLPTPGPDELATVEIASSATGIARSPRGTVLPKVVDSQGGAPMRWMAGNTQMVARRLRARLLPPV